MNVCCIQSQASHMFTYRIVYLARTMAHQCIGCVRLCICAFPFELSNCQSNSYRNVKCQIEHMVKPRLDKRMREPLRALRFQRQNEKEKRKIQIIHILNMIFLPLANRKCFRKRPLHTMTMIVNEQLTSYWAVLFFFLAPQWGFQRVNQVERTSRLCPVSLYVVHFQCVICTALCEYIYI